MSMGGMAAALTVLVQAKGVGPSLKKGTHKQGARHGRPKGR